MLALFRNNRVTTALGLLLYAAAIRAAAFTGVVAPVAGADEGCGALYRPLFGWAHQSALLSALIAAGLVIIQGIQINRLTDRFRITSDRSWLPGLLYVWFASCLPEFLFLSPPLVAVTFLTPMFANIFRSYKMPDATRVVFDAGFWIAVAGLFYPPALWLIAAVYLGLNTMRSFSLREQAVLVTGLLVPGFLAWVGYLWVDRGWEFWQVQFGSRVGLFRWTQTPDLRDGMKLALLALSLLTAVLNSQAYIRKKLINIQKYISVLYIFCLLTGLALLLRPEARPEYALLLAPALGIFLGMALQNIRNQLIAELAHLLLFAAVLFIQFWPAGA